VSLPFDRGEAFSFDKAADVPCRYLLRSHRCSVHGSLRERGLAGCANYDCYGAGQRLTAEFLRGRSWRDDRGFASHVFDAFRSLKRLHELCALLTRAEGLSLPAAEEDRRRQLLAELESSGGATLESLRSFDVETAEREVLAFLRSLRHTFRSPAESPCINRQIAGKPTL
jgi:hypothetical protein